jgi:hypothetical protein
MKQKHQKVSTDALQRAQTQHDNPQELHERGATHGGRNERRGLIETRGARGFTCGQRGQERLVGDAKLLELNGRAGGPSTGIVNIVADVLSTLLVESYDHAVSTSLEHDHCSSNLGARSQRSSPSFRFRLDF